MTLVYCDCADCEHIDPAEGTCDRAGITIGFNAACLSARRTNKGGKTMIHIDEQDGVILRHTKDGDVYIDDLPDIIGNIAALRENGEDALSGFMAIIEEMTDMLRKHYKCKITITDYEALTRKAKALKEEWVSVCDHDKEQALDDVKAEAERMEGMR